jgi:malonate-semialdehyde dehydrogenase (acetylating)/methylmalonate-semialdehyde dehydrogenase
MQVPHFEDGNFVGPTVLADVKSDMDCYKVFVENVFYSLWL